MGANASTEAIVLEAISKNDVRKLREPFSGTDAERKPLILLKLLTQPVLDLVHNPEKKDDSKIPTPYTKWLGMSPIHIASEMRDTRILVEMIAILSRLHGQKVEIEDGQEETLTSKRVWAVRDEFGLTALSRAVRASNPRSVEILLNAGADISEVHCAKENEKNNSIYWSHVRYCAASGLSGVLKLLLARGADIFSWSKDGRRPIHLAIEAGHLDCVKLLLEADGTPAEEPGSHVQRRVRAVGKYIVRECTVQYANEQGDAEITTQPSTGENPGAGPEVRERQQRIDILSIIQSALQDAVRSASNAPQMRGNGFRGNRDRGASLLHLACTNSHPHILSYLLSKEEFADSIEYMNDSGKSPIFMAIRHGSLECLKLLVQAGARVDTKDIENWTVLHEAVKAGDSCVEILQFLIDECSCDINAVDDDGWTALHVAARFSSTRAVDILVKAGCNIDAKTEDQETAVLLASAQSSSSEVLRKLLQNGADLSVHRDTALTPSRLILGRRDFEQLCILLDHIKTLDERSRKEVIDLESRSDTGDTLLHLCVMEQNVEATSKLLAVGARPNEKNHEGIAALHTVCKNGNGAIADAILEAGGDPHIARADGMLPLHIACDSGHTAVVAALIRHGCVVNRPVSQSGRYTGFTALMFAARLGNFDITSQLIRAGADLDSQKGDGFTALHLAALNGNTSVCKGLVEAGANYRVADDTGYYPLQLATRHNQFDVVSTLLESNVEADSCNQLGLTSLHIASFICDARLIWLLIRGGANVNAVNSDDATPLHVAAGREQGKVSMQLLLANGARMDMTDSEKDTPLHNACYKGLYQNVRLLLRRGAAPSPVNQYNVTPLHLAAAVGNEETIEALLRYGADVDIRDSNDKTPYKVASENDNRKAMVLLFRSMTLSLEDIAPTSTFARSENPASSADEVMCVICQNSLAGGDETRALPCTHTYHDACILAWLGGENLLRHDSCPLCQKSVLPESASPRRPF